MDTTWLGSQGDILGVEKLLKVLNIDILGNFKSPMGISVGGGGVSLFITIYAYFLVKASS